MRFLRPITSAARASASTALYCVLLFSLIVAPVSSLAGDGPIIPTGNLLCHEELAELDPAPVDEVAKILASLKQHCADETLCGDLKLKETLERAIETHGKGHRTWLRSLMRIPRRLLILALYSGSVIGPGVLTYYLTSTWNIPDGQRIILGSSVSSISGMLLGRSGSALERMLGPHLEQTVMTVWDPNDSDSWGKIQKALNEKDRLINSQIYNQLLIFRRHFEHAGRAIKGNYPRGDERPNFGLAANHYAQAIIHSYNLFGGLHYYHPATVGEVRAYLPKSGEFMDQIDMTLEQKVELIIRVCRTIQEKPRDEIVNGVPKEDLVRFAFGVMVRWLVIHEKGATPGQALPNSDHR